MKNKDNPKRKLKADIHITMRALKNIEKQINDLTNAYNNIVMSIGQIAQDSLLMKQKQHTCDWTIFETSCKVDLLIDKLIAAKIINMTPEEIKDKIDGEFKKIEEAKKKRDAESAKNAPQKETPKNETMDERVEREKAEITAAFKQKGKVAEGISIIK